MVGETKVKGASIISFWSESGETKAASALDRDKYKSDKIYEVLTLFLEESSDPQAMAKPWIPIRQSTAAQQENSAKTRQHKIMPVHLPEGLLVALPERQELLVPESARRSTSPARPPTIENKDEENYKLYSFALYERDAELYITPQKSGVCSLKSLYFFVREFIYEYHREKCYNRANLRPFAGLQAGHLQEQEVQQDEQEEEGGRGDEASRQNLDELLLCLKQAHTAGFWQFKAFVVDFRWDALRIGEKWFNHLVDLSKKASGTPTPGADEQSSTAHSEDMQKKDIDILIL